MPTAAAGLVNLIRFNIDFNQLPPKPLPLDFTAWTQLTHFNAGGIGATGTLPKEYGSAWPNLLTFSADQNSFSGLLPREYGQWTQLTFFSVAQDTALNSTLPAEYAAWTKLNEMHLSSNSLTGSIPAEWLASGAMCSAAQEIPCEIDLMYQYSKPPEKLNCTPPVPIPSYINLEC